MRAFNDRPTSSHGFRSLATLCLAACVGMPLGIVLFPSLSGELALGRGRVRGQGRDGERIPSSTICYPRADSR